jgi:hypothetical protein
MLEGTFVATDDMRELALRPPPILGPTDEPSRNVLASRLLGGFAPAGLAPLLGGGVPQLAPLYLAAPVRAALLPPTPLGPRATPRGELEPDALASELEEAPNDALCATAVAVWHGAP